MVMNFWKKTLSAAVALAFSGGASYALFYSSIDRLIANNTSVPVVSTCSTGALTAGSSDTAGDVTATGATACTITFGTAFVAVPSCVVSDYTTAAALKAAVTNTAIVVTGLTSGDRFSWICMAKAGG
jgi:hypothetical protein